jgi:kinesin light chain
MTQMTQEEIMTNTKTVVQGLEALKNEHNSILNGLTSSLELAVSVVERAQQAVQQQNVSSGGVTSGVVGDASVVEEKKGLVQKSLDMIELGLGEAQVGSVLLHKYQPCNVLASYHELISAGCKRP